MLAGSCPPQPAFSAAMRTTLACRDAPPTELGAVPALAPSAVSSFRRNATGSIFSLCAASSMKLSSAQLVKPGPDRAQPARTEGLVGEVVGDRPHLVRADGVPVVGAVDREGVEGNVLLALGHEERRHDFGGPAGGDSGAPWPSRCRPCRRPSAASAPTASATLVELDVVVARQDHLHRLADRLGGERRADGVVAVRAAGRSRRPAGRCS